MNANERIKEIEHKMCELQNEIWKLRDERNELYKQNAQYFIVTLLEQNSYGDYDEYYYPLGFTTEAEAKDFSIKRNIWCYIEDDDEFYWGGSKEPYFAVTEEEFNMYKRWRDLVRAGRQIRKNDDPVYEFINKEIENLREKLGVTDSYMHIEIERWS